MARDFDYEKIRPDQLSDALDALGFTMRHFAWLSGAAPDRVQRWLSGTEDIPHWVGVVAGMATVPEARAIGEAFTRRVATHRQFSEKRQ